MLVNKLLDAPLNGTEDEGTAAIVPSGMFKKIKLPID
jgi:hypothetical protein